MKKLLFSAASMLLFLGSCCQNELEENVLPKGQSVVTATIEGQNDSRLAVTPNADNSVFTLNWSEGDSFKVFDDGEGAVYEWTSGEEFTASTTPTNPTYAVYPYTASNAPTISGSTVTMTLNATPSVANINLPMWAGAPTNNNYAFKHLAAALQFTLNDIPAGYNQLIVTASNAISGAFTADLNASEPVLASTSTADADKKVTVSFDAATTGTKNVIFYIPLPAGTYTSLAVSVSDGTNTKELKSWANLEVVRGKMYYTTATVDATSVNAVNEALANVGEVATTVNLTEAITTDTPIEIPEAAKNVTLNFAETPTTSENAPLTINQNDGETSGTATSELNVTMPSTATGLYATIDAPTTTVTLNGGSYSKVTATTATNTLIIGEGVTIEELVINGGNVVLNGNVKSISSTADTTRVTLGDNISLNQSLKFTAGTITLDMNGQTITANGDGIEVTDGTLTITGNGTVKAGQETTPADTYVAVWANGGDVIIENGTYEIAADKNGHTNDCAYAKKSTITINGGTFTSWGTYNPPSGGMVVNANNKADFAGSKVTINGGTFNLIGDARFYENGDYTEGRVVFGTDASYTMNLTTDVTISKAITIPTGITATINLNGFDVTAPNTDAFEVQGILTIEGTDESVVKAGTVKEETGSVCAVWAHNGGEVTIDGGHYIVYEDKDGKRNDCIYAGSNAQETSGTITINGGKFEYGSETGTETAYNGHLFLLNCANSQPTSKITVNGGSFKNHVPSFENLGTTGEVVLGEDVNVYNEGGTEQTSAHTSGTEVWYTVKESSFGNTEYIPV